MDFPHNEKWWIWKRAFANEGLWPLIKNIAIPAFVWANLLEPHVLEDGTLNFEWHTRLEDMSSLLRVVMAFEVWAQWEDDVQSKFATKGHIEFGKIGKFCSSGLDGNLAIQWVGYAKYTMKELGKLGVLWKTP